MVSAKEIYDYIDGFAPFDTQMSYDNSGLLVGDFNTRSRKVVLALDADKQVIDEAVGLGAKIIVTHHPVIFNPLRSVMFDSVPYAAAKNDITIISAHTNLDIACGGVNDCLAKAVGVYADRRFDEDCAIFGHLDDAATAECFAKRIKLNMGLNGLRYTNVNDSIKTAVVSCGAGGGNIFMAAELGADSFITGEIKHHEIIFANEHNISVFDLGHFNSEDMIIDRLTVLLSKQFPEAEFVKSKVFSDKTIYIK